MTEEAREMNDTAVCKCLVCDEKLTEDATHCTHCGAVTTISVEEAQDARTVIQEGGVPSSCPLLGKKA